MNLTTYEHILENIIEENKQKYYFDRFSAQKNYMEKSLTKKQINRFPGRIYIKEQKVCIGSAVVRVMDSHSCVRGSTPSQGNHIREALKSIQFISDESSVEILLYIRE